MRAQRQDNWDADDFELEAEFEDITSLVRNHTPKPPKVPSRLDRLIRKQANFGAIRTLESEWVFSPPLQLALAALLLFGIGITYVFSLAISNTDHDLTNHGPESHSIFEAGQAVTTNQPELTGLKLKDKSLRGDSNSWIELSFTINQLGEAQEIKIIERCHRITGASDCAKSILPSMQLKLDTYAIGQLQDRHFQPAPTSNPSRVRQTVSIFVP